MGLEEGFSWLTAECREGAHVPFHNVKSFRSSAAVNNKNNKQKR